MKTWQKYLNGLINGKCCLIQSIQRKLKKLSFLAKRVLLIMELIILTKCRSSRPEVFCKKVLLRPATLFQKRLWQRCFPINFGRFLRTHFHTEHLRWLLLKMSTVKENVQKHLGLFLDVKYVNEKFMKVNKGINAIKNSTYYYHTLHW